MRQMAEQEAMANMPELEPDDSAQHNGDVPEQAEAEAVGTGAKSKKKKKPRGAASAQQGGCSSSGCSADHSHGPPSGAPEAQIPASYIRDLQKAMGQVGMTDGPAHSLEEAKKKTYQFWSSQPVQKFTDGKVENVNEPVEPDKMISDIRPESYSLPTGFVWDTINLDVDEQLKELYKLLNENYVEDDDNMFRFDYSPEFLLWALKPPGWRAEWYCGVRSAKSGKLVAFISAVPAKIRIHSKTVNMVEINFLCVHKKLRSKRVAPVLIREITRRVNLRGIFQACYTAGIVLPKPVGACRYWHRSLNPKKLIEVKFSHLKRNMTMQRTIKLYKLEQSTKHDLALLNEGDIESALNLLSEYLLKFKLGPIWTTQEEFKHWFLPQEDVVSTYVLRGVDEHGKPKVTDLVSFYTLPSTVVNNPKYSALKAAYSFYTVATTISMHDLMYDALVLAKNNNFDVFNALDLMENNKDNLLEQLKFGIGDGNLNYYLYNWKCASLESEEIGLVLQ